MSSYEREWFVYPEDDEGIPAPSRLHVGLTATGGEPVRFLVQLEYWDGERWLQVARFDHDSDGPAYRDVERSGLHLDIYGPQGRQVAKLQKWSPQPPNEAMGDAEEYLRDDAEQYTRRFETWL